jgi:hypothetical protein
MTGGSILKMILIVGTVGFLLYSAVQLLGDFETLVDGWKLGNIYPTK